MRSAQEVEKAFASGSVRAFEITQVGEGGGFVEQHPIGNAVAESACDSINVVSKARRRIAIGPAAGIFERLRQVPVIEGDEGANSGFQQGIDEAAVVINAFGIGRSGPGGLNARPGNRKAIAVQIHRAKERDVFAPAMIGIAGQVAGVAGLDFARSVREAVPDRFAFAVVHSTRLRSDKRRWPRPRRSPWGMQCRKKNQNARRGNWREPRNRCCAPHSTTRCSLRIDLPAARLRCPRRGRSAQIGGESDAK